MTLLKDSQSFEKNFSTQDKRPLQQPRVRDRYKHIEENMRNTNRNDLQRFIGLIKRI